MPLLGDKPVEPEYVQSMKAIGHTIDNLLNGSDDTPRKVGFILMVFSFEENGKPVGRCNYMSNANRADVVCLLKEQIKRFEGQPEMVGHA